ncbi:MAG: DUF599 domain-containing protein [Gammaproteobacteria bacterium]
MAPYIIDIGTYALSLGLIGGYHVYLKARLRRDPSYTIQSVNSDARAAWVENIMAEKNNAILAVQTLRNSTMAATFLASTAILLMMGTLNLVQNSSGQNNLLHSLQSGIAAGDDLEQIKLLILLATFFWAFFSFSLALRLYNHVGYLINAGNEKSHFHPTPHYISRLLNRSGNYYSQGMRAYYISVPLVFALFNPYYIVIASVALIMALYHIDRAPDTQPYVSDIERKRLNESQLKLKITASEDRRKISGF